MLAHAAMFINIRNCEILDAFDRKPSDFSTRNPRGINWKEHMLKHAAHYVLNDRDVCCVMGWKVQGEFRGRMKRQVYIHVNGGLVQGRSSHLRGKNAEQGAKVWNMDFTVIV